MENQQEYLFFNFGCQVSFVSFNPVNNFIIPTNVVLQLEQSSIISLKELEIVKRKAIEQLVGDLGNDKAELLADKAEVIYVCVTSVSLLGQGTEEEFVGKK